MVYHDNYTSIGLGAKVLRGALRNSWWPALICTSLAVLAVSSEQAQLILPDDFLSHALGGHEI